MLADSFMINHKQEVRVNSGCAPYMSSFFFNLYKPKLSQLLVHEDWACLRHPLKKYGPYLYMNPSIHALP